MTRLIAAFLLLGSLLPLAGWIPGGESDAGYWARLQDWMLGTALCVVVGGLVWFVTRARQRNAMPASLTAHVADVADNASREAVPSDPSRDALFSLALSLAALGLYVVVAQWIFSGRPLLIDEIVHVLQARDYASGALTHATRLPREFFSILHEVDVGPRSYGQYPAGGPAMLVPGVWLGAEWLVGPVAGALCVWCFSQLLPALEPEWTQPMRRSALVLFAVAPFGVFMFGSHMNHATVLLWILVALLALTRATTDRASSWWGLLTGLSLGVAATIRPLDAAAFAVPAAVWLGWRARRGGNALTTWLLSGVGVVLPMALLLWVNVRTTGHPLRFGYDVLWGAGHALGFHEAAWGTVHTPARGVELISLYLTRLSSYLFETPFPALLLPAAGLWMARTVRSLDRYLLVSAGCLLIGYWAYWHDGFFLGPRFVFALLPVLVVWSVRGVVALRARLGPDSAAWRGARAALIAGALYSLVTISVVRAPTYKNGLLSMRLSPEREAAAAKVEGAVVLVQESWGAQLMVRLWASGVDRSFAERLYRNVDACRLEMALGALEQQGVRDTLAHAALLPLLADSALVVPGNLSPDLTERMQPGLQYTPRCVARIEEDRGGYLLYAPWRLARDSNIYARWLPGREADVRALYPGRPVYRVRRAGAEEGAPLHWEQLDAPEDVRRATRTEGSIIPR